MTRPALTIFVTSAVWAVVSASVLAATAEEQFESVYGKEYRAAVASRETADDVTVASHLLSGARTAGEAELKALLCEKAYLLGLKDASGWETSIAAMDLLAETVPARKAECLEKIAAVRQNVFDAASGSAWNEAGEALVAALVALAEAKLEADDVTGARGCAIRAKAAAEKVRSACLAEVQAVADRVEVFANLVPLKRVIEMNPENRGAREKLLKIYLVELDDPVSAAKFVERDRDDNLDKFILVAAMDPANVPERGLMELGAWYQGLAEEAGPAGKPAMLARAKGYYERYLEVHTEGDLERSKAASALQQVETALEKLAAPAPPDPAWVDLLKLVNLSRHVVAGTWAPKGNGVGVLPFPDAYLAIPALPDGNYELQVGFSRTTVSGQGVAIALPVGKGMALLRLGGESRTSYRSSRSRLGSRRTTSYSSGLELVRGDEFNHNSTTRDGSSVATQSRHVVEITVTLDGNNAEVAVKLDGKDYIKWKGAQGDLTCPELKTRKQVPKALGLSADSSTVLFDGARVRVTTGQLKRL